MNKLTTINLLDTSKTIAENLISSQEYPWQVLGKISEFIIALGNSLPKDEYTQIKENVWVANSSNIYSTALINGPTIIDKDAEIRHCAFIRGNAIIGKGAVVGNSTELKNVILFDKVQVPHYNYVGDSILGYKAHMGAGSITSNVKSDKTNVTISLNSDKVETGLRKFGAIIGDYCEIGCNSVLNPGTIIGRNSNIYPLSMVRGYVDENSIYKNKNEVIIKK